MVIKRFLLLVVALLCLTPSLALWEDISQDIYLGVFGNQLVEGFNVRVTDIRVETQEVDLLIKDSKGKKIFEGTVSPEMPFEHDLIKLTPHDIKYYDPARTQAKLKAEKRVEAEIINSNFPDEVFKSDTYKVFVTLKNTGPGTGIFNVTFTSGGNFHVFPSDQDTPMQHHSSNIKKIINTASQVITLESGKEKRVYFGVRISGVEGEELKPVFQVHTNSGSFIDEYKIGTVPLVNNLVGYIVDIIAPDSMLAGREELVKVRIRNSWMGSSNDFVIELIAPEFLSSKSIERITALPETTKELTFRVNPYGGGIFTIAAELSVGGKLVDTFGVDTTVLGEKVYSIKKVEAPKELKKGDTGMIFVTVQNQGTTTNTMSVSLESDDFEIKTPEAVLKLQSEKETKILFNAKLLKNSGIATLDVNLFDTPEKYSTSLYNKKGKLIDTKPLRINVEGSATTPVKKPEEIEEIQEEVGVVIEEGLEEATEETTDAEEETTDHSTQEFRFDQMGGMWPYLAILALVVLVIIIVLASRRRKEPEVEIYDLEKEMKDSKKKAKKSKKK